ncbi:hypothetical protein EVAR_87186_1 [Eumeta japonica]|uniref:Uncharacterized protein n=1 Tax=Eumeta variegata TaxID=151549 RepID=A0A4C1VXU1_EUMVA|nr:hypothetical protein EVAR_87186_1 [Eumeta japonica]
MCLRVSTTESVVGRTASHSGGAVIGSMACVTALPAYLIFRSVVRLWVAVLLVFTTAGHIDEVAYRYRFPTDVHPIKSDKDVPQLRLTLQNDCRDTVLGAIF